MPNNTITTLNIDDYYNRPLSEANKIICTDNRAAIENNVQTNLDKDFFSRDRMDMSNESLNNKVLNWLSYSEFVTEDKSGNNLSDNNYCCYLRDCGADAEKLNECFASIPSIDVNEINRQFQNDEQVNNVFSQTHCNLTKILLCLL